jgi:hypothetical protein
LWKYEVMRDVFDWRDRAIPQDTLPAGGPVNNLAHISGVLVTRKALGLTIKSQILDRRRTCRTDLDLRPLPALR